MSWEYICLSKEPNLSISPLLEEKDLFYFIDREKETKLLKTYIESEYSKHIIISSKAGIGKTSLVCYANRNKNNNLFLRIDLSGCQNKKDILDKITIDLLEFACTLKIKKAYDLKDEFLY